MPDSVSDSAEFYLRRQRQERGLALESPDEVARKLHLQVADRYADLAFAQMEKKLRLISNRG